MKPESSANESPSVVGKVPSEYADTLKECADILAREDLRRGDPFFRHPEMRSVALRSGSLQVRSFGYRAYPPMGVHRQKSIVVSLGVPDKGNYEVVIDPQEFTYEVVDQQKYLRQEGATVKDSHLGSTIGSAGYVSRMPCEWEEVMGPLAFFLESQSPVFFGEHHRLVQPDHRTGHLGYKKEEILLSDQDRGSLIEIVSRIRSLLRSGR